jgi:fluoroquinolone transport system permease protein
MRITNAIKADVKFQVKQGFYAVYVIITLIYMLVIYQLPDHMGQIVVPLIIYFDPSIVGFFFIGGIVMLEKAQGVLDYLVVTPLRSKEYLMAKAISLTLLAIVASSVITLVTYRGSVQWILLIVGIGVSSLLFTLYGFFVAAKCKSVNEYFVKMLPYMFFIVLPCFLLLIKTPYSWIFNIFPSVAGLKLIYGAFIGIHWMEATLNLIYLVFITVFCLHSVDKIIFGGGFGE